MRVAIQSKELLVTTTSLRSRSSGKWIDLFQFMCPRNQPEEAVYGEWEDQSTMNWCNLGKKENDVSLVIVRHIYRKECWLAI